MSNLQQTLNQNILLGSILYSRSQHKLDRSKYEHFTRQKETFARQSADTIKEYEKELKRLESADIGISENYDEWMASKKDLEDKIDDAKREREYILKKADQVEKGTIERTKGINKVFGDYKDAANFADEFNEFTRGYNGHYITPLSEDARKVNEFEREAEQKNTQNIINENNEAEQDAQNYQAQQSPHPLLTKQMGYEAQLANVGARRENSYQIAQTGLMESKQNFLDTQSYLEDYAKRNQSFWEGGKF